MSHNAVPVRVMMCVCVLCRQHRDRRLYYSRTEREPTPHNHVGHGVLASAFGKVIPELRADVHEEGLVQDGSHHVGPAAREMRLYELLVGARQHRVPSRERHALPFAEGNHHARVLLLTRRFGQTVHEVVVEAERL